MIAHSIDEEEAGVFVYAYVDKCDMNMVIKSGLKNPLELLECGYFHLSDTAAMRRKNALVEYKTSQRFQSFLAGKIGYAVHGTELIESDEFLMYHMIWRRMKTYEISFEKARTSIKFWFYPVPENACQHIKDMVVGKRLLRFWLSKDYMSKYDIRSRTYWMDLYASEAQTCSLNSFDDMGYSCSATAPVGFTVMTVRPEFLVPLTDTVTEPPEDTKKTRKPNTDSDKFTGVFPNTNWKAASKITHPRFISNAHETGAVQHLSPEWFGQRLGKVSGSKLTDMLCFTFGDETKRDAQQKSMRAFRNIVHPEAYKEEYSEATLVNFRWGNDHEMNGIVSWLEENKNYTVKEQTFRNLNKDVFLSYVKKYDALTGNKSGNAQRRQMLQNLDRPARRDIVRRFEGTVAEISGSSIDGDVYDAEDMNNNPHTCKPVSVLEIKAPCPFIRCDKNPGFFKYIAKRAYAGVPVYYIPQVQWEMGICNHEDLHFVCWVPPTGDVPKKTSTYKLAFDVVFFMEMLTLLDDIKAFYVAQEREMFKKGTFSLSSRDVPCDMMPDDLWRRIEALHQKCAEMKEATLALRKDISGACSVLGNQPVFLDRDMKPNSTWGAISIKDPFFDKTRHCSRIGNEMATEERETTSSIQMPDTCYATQDMPMTYSQAMQNETHYEMLDTHGTHTHSQTAMNLWSNLVHPTQDVEEEESYSKLVLFDYEREWEEAHRLNGIAGIESITPGAVKEAEDEECPVVFELAHHVASDSTAPVSTPHVFVSDQDIDKIWEEHVKEDSQHSVLYDSIKLVAPDAMLLKAGSLKREAAIYVCSPSPFKYDSYKDCIAVAGIQAPEQVPRQFVMYAQLGMLSVGVRKAMYCFWAPSGDCSMFVLHRNDQYIASLLKLVCMRAHQHDEAGPFSSQVVEKTDAIRRACKRHIVPTIVDANVSAGLMVFNGHTTILNERDRPTPPSPASQSPQPVLGKRKASSDPREDEIKRPKT